MDGLDFIKFYHTEYEALCSCESHYNQSGYKRGIQLLPNNPLPYVQRTSYSQGVYVEDQEVILINLGTREEFDITSYFKVDKVVYDDDGTNQILWSLLNLPYDFHGDYVALRIEQLGQFYYSSAFQLTDDYSTQTKRFDYGDDLENNMQSIQLILDYRQNLKDTDIESYYEISTGNVVTSTIKATKYKKFDTGFIDNDLLITLSDIFDVVYTFMNLQKVNLQRVVEIPELTGLTNTTQSPIYLGFENQFFDPLNIKVNHYSQEHYSSLHYSTT